MEKYPYLDQIKYGLTPQRDSRPISYQKKEVVVQVYAITKPIFKIINYLVLRSHHVYLWVSVIITK